MTVIEAGSDKPIVAYPDELVHDAMYRMLQHNIGRLPVVSRDDPQQMVGYFNRSSMLGAWARQIEEEGFREHGWIRKWTGSSPHCEANPANGGKMNLKSATTATSETAARPAASAKS